jgi:chromate transporter
MVALAIAGALVTLFTSLDTIWVILGGGLIGILIAMAPRLMNMAALLLPLSLPGGAAWLAPAAGQSSMVAPLWQLGLFFLKVGATLMGSGYVLISYMEHDLVANGWFTRQQVLDAIAAGQMTPGPVFTTAAFVGYVNQAGAANDITAGVVGAAVCAAAIFLPSFLIVLLIAPWIQRMRESQIAGAFLDGVNAAVVGSIAAITWTLLLTAVVNLPQPILALPLMGARVDLLALALVGGSAFVLLRYPQFNSAALIAIGALLGFVVQMLL